MVNVHHMSNNQITTEKEQVWKHGTRGNNIEFANIKLLEKYEPNTHKLIEWKEGFTCQDHDYEYKVGMSKWGLWLSRKRLELSQNQSQITPPKTVENSNLVTTHQHTNDEKIFALEKRVSAMESWIKKVSESAVMNL